MNRRVLSVAVVAILVVLAGCGGTGSQPTPAETSEPSTETASKKTDGLPSDLLAKHESNIRDRESFTAKHSLTLDAPSTDEPVTVTRTYRVDLAGDKRVVTSEHPSGESVRFTTGNITYIKRTPTNSDTSAYAKARKPYTDDSIEAVKEARAMGVSSESFLPAALTDQLTYEKSGQTTVNGETVSVFTTTVSEDSSVGENLGSVNGMALSNATFTMYVDNQSVIRKASWSVTYRNESASQTLSGTITITNLGSTDVQSPSWTDKAR